MHRRDGCVQRIIHNTLCKLEPVSVLGRKHSMPPIQTISAGVDAVWIKFHSSNPKGNADWSLCDIHFVSVLWWLRESWALICHCAICILFVMQRFYMKFGRFDRRLNSFYWQCYFPFWWTAENRWYVCVWNHLGFLLNHNYHTSLFLATCPSTLTTAPIKKPMFTCIQKCTNIPQLCTQFIVSEPNCLPQVWCAYKVFELLCTG